MLTSNTANMSRPLAGLGAERLARRGGGEPEEAAGVVYVICPGGLEHGGGIGRQMGYFLGSVGVDGPSIDHRVLDSRGPRFLGGASPLLVGGAALHLFGAILALLAGRFAARPAVAHVNITGRGSTVRKAILTAVMRAIGMRHLLHVHDYDYSAEYRRHGRLMQMAIRRTFAEAERIIVLGAAERTRLARTLGLPVDKLTALPNAVPDPLIGHPAAERDATHLVFLGHLSERKGVPELLDALARPELRDRVWRATIAGGGDIARYQRRAAELGIAERISFPGWLDREAVRSLCGAAEILVLPSHAEGLAMALLEGLSHGMAVIATPVGSHEEVIDDGVSGLFVTPGDVASLAAALLRVLEDSALRQRLRAGARARFLERFEIGGYAQRLRALHAELLSGREKRPIAAVSWR